MPLKPAILYRFVTVKNPNDDIYRRNLTNISSDELFWVKGRFLVTTKEIVEFLKNDWVLTRWEIFVITCFLARLYKEVISDDHLKSILETGDDNDR